jgi:hypothetical protein
MYIYTHKRHVVCSAALRVVVIYSIAPFCASECIAISIGTRFESIG